MPTTQQELLSLAGRILWTGLKSRLDSRKREGAKGIRFEPIPVEVRLIGPIKAKTQKEVGRLVDELYSHGSQLLVEVHEPEIMKTTIVDEYIVVLGFKFYLDPSIGRENARDHVEKELSEIAHDSDLLAWKVRITRK